MYPLIGKRVFIDYKTAKFNVHYIDENHLKFEGGIGNKNSKEIVEYSCVIVSPGIFMLYWFEPISKHFVTQVQNLNTFKIYSNIINLSTTEFYHFKGSIIVMKEKESVESSDNKQNTKSKDRDAISKD